jgi:hypothetical protein
MDTFILAYAFYGRRLGRCVYFGIVTSVHFNTAVTSFQNYVATGKVLVTIKLVTET